MLYRLLLVTGLLAGLVACEPVPGAGGPGVSASGDARQQATREARREVYRGPRGGSTGR